MVSRRHEDKSIVVTTNRVFREWKEVFPNATCVVALVDRLVHRAEIISIDADSYRLKEAKEREAGRRTVRLLAPPLNVSSGSKVTYLASLM